MGLRRALCALSVAALSCAALASSSEAAKAPSGLAFYTPPASALAGTHGSVIWSRPLSGVAALKGAGRNVLVLYRSRSLSGRAIAVSGTVAIPKGTAPRGGWPIVSYAHGTTGGADVCAPSRDTPTGPAHGYIDYTDVQLNAWLKAGYAVVRTDYEGLGTPGPHPYLIGHSEARGVIDIVRAARALDPSLSRSWVAAGHSQGGHAALFAAADGPTWAPDLRLRGVVAFAPGSHILDEVRLAKSLVEPSALSGLGSLIVTGAAAASPDVDLASVLKPQAFALVPQVQTKCLSQLSATSSWGALAPADIISDTADLTALDRVLAAMNPGSLKLHVPLLLAQGSADGTVFPMYTDMLDKELTAGGASIEDKTYPGVDHGGIVKAAEPAALAFFAKRFG